MDELKSVISDPGRDKPEVVNDHKETLKKQSYLKDLYNAITDIVLILNDKRQVVFYNEELVKSFELEKDIYGLRPGEVLDCINSYQTEGGCGTAEFCRTCGALHSIQNSILSGEKDTKECRIIQKASGEALDMQVTSTPLKLAGKMYTIFAMKDISHEKRRKVLERVFFHDILNTAGGIKAISELINDASEEDLELFRGLLNSSSEKLVDEIFSQRDLTAAENGELYVNWELVESVNLLNKIRDVYLVHEVSKNKDLQIDSNSLEITFSTDKALISRILGNLVKNALEASDEGQKVTMGCYTAEKNVVFYVHNFTFIPEDVQLQLFNRSFSTKGNNRGIGTYSIKLFTEKYLKGHVLFSSTPEEGTTFRITFPINN